MMTSLNTTMPIAGNHEALFFYPCKASKNDINPQHHIPIAFAMCYPAKFDNDEIEDHDANHRYFYMFWHPHMDF